MYNLQTYFLWTIYSLEAVAEAVAVQDRDHAELKNQKAELSPVQP